MAAADDGSDEPLVGSSEKFFGPPAVWLNSPIWSFRVPGLIMKRLGGNFSVGGQKIAPSAH